MKYKLQKDDYSCGPIALENLYSFYGVKMNPKERKRAYGRKTAEEGTSLRFIDGWLRPKFNAEYIHALKLWDIDYCLDSGGCALIHYKPFQDEPHYGLVVSLRNGVYVIANHYNGYKKNYEHAQLNCKELTTLLQRGGPEEGCGWMISMRYKGCSK